MKKISLSLLVLSLIGLATWSAAVTVWDDGFGHPFAGFAGFTNLSSAQGRVTVRVNTLAPTVAVGAGGLTLRANGADLQVSPNGSTGWLNLTPAVVFRNHSGTVQYDDDGTWRAVASASAGLQYGLTGTGAGVLATLTPATPSGWFAATGDLTFAAVVRYTDLARAEVIYEHEATAYSDTIAQIEKTVDNKLAFTSGDLTYTSLNTVFDTGNQNLPMSLMVVVNATAGTITFCHHGLCESAQTGYVAGTIPTGAEIHRLGNGFKGALFFAVLTASAIHVSGAPYPPLTEGLSAWPDAWVLYDCDSPDTTLVDRVHTVQGTTPAYDLTISDGTWTAFDVSHY